MGLANIKKCADTMTLESQVGVGTKLEVTIFLRPDSNGDSNQAEVKKQELT